MSKAEKFIQENTKRCSEGVRPFEEWITPVQARRAVEIARAEMIEKACKWLQCHYRVIDGEVEDFIWSLKQAMKDEL